MLDHPCPDHSNSTPHPLFLSSPFSHIQNAWSILWTVFDEQHIMPSLLFNELQSIYNIMNDDLTHNYLYHHINNMLNFLLRHHTNAFWIDDVPDQNNIVCDSIRSISGKVWAHHLWMVGFNKKQIEPFEAFTCYIHQPFEMQDHDNQNVK